jgi:hypothetical protein
MIDLVLELASLSGALLHERCSAGGLNAKQRNDRQQQDGTY